MHIGKFKRFSMCNCLTIRMDRAIKKINPKALRTYTAHLMSTDLFLKLAHPGVNIRVPLKDYWPEKRYIKVYTIPKNIITFLFSPFNEAFHTNYCFGSSVQYTVPKKLSGKLICIARDKKFDVKQIKKSAQDFAKDLEAMNKKVSKIWNVQSKILIFYDNTYAPESIRDRLVLFDSIAKNVLGWPYIQIKEKKTKVNKDSIYSWQHYNNKTHIKLAKQIEFIERSYKNI